jgi:hypothetical protein
VHLDFARAACGGLRPWALLDLQPASLAQAAIRQHVAHPREVGEDRRDERLRALPPAGRSLRRLIGQEDHTYYNGYEFGDGPNWRIRVARVGLEKLGLGPDLVRHGIKREVYAMPLTDNFRDMLKGKARRLTTKRPSVREIASVALERWLLPRAQTRREYRNVRKDVYLATQKQILINVTT